MTKLKIDFTARQHAVIFFRNREKISERYPVQNEILCEIRRLFEGYERETLIKRNIQLPYVSINVLSPLVLKPVKGGIALFQTPSLS